MTPALRVVTPGLMTTLQDLGRPGYQRFGIPVSGAMDAVSLRAANMLAGNAQGMGALEIAYQGPTLTVEAECVRVAYAGASALVEVVSDPSGPEVQRVPQLQSIRLRKGKVLRIGALSGGAVGYLAVEGGFDIAPALGSQSTFVRAGLGGQGGRALRQGDSLPLAHSQAEDRAEQMFPSLELAPPRRFRVVLGPQDDYFSQQGKRTFLQSTYTVTAASDRMGMRLAGPVLEHAKGFNIVSDGIAPGSIQVPGNGLPIVLLADRQTTGGYPKIATVIAADMPALGRLTPGAKIAFEAVDIETAEAAHRQLHRDMDTLLRSIVQVKTATINAMALLEANLVSGMIDAHDWRPERA